MDYDYIRQDIFNRAFVGLKKQGFVQSLKIDQRYAPSDTTAPLVCSYSGTEGRRCAVGHLFLDETVAKHFDKYGAIGDCVDRSDPNDVNAFLKALGIDPTADIEMVLPFLTKLQETHDANDRPDQMEMQLRHLAQSWMLTTP